MNEPSASNNSILLAGPQVHCEPAYDTLICLELDYNNGYPLGCIVRYFNEKHGLLMDDYVLMLSPFDHLLLAAD